MSDDTLKNSPAIVPHLIIKDADKAIDFYINAFGFQEYARLKDPRNGTVMYASLGFGNSQIAISEECPEWNSFSPLALNGSPITIHLNVDDVDSLFDKVVEAGATVIMPLDNTFWGARYGQVVDPFGHKWALSTMIEELTFEQMNQGFEKMLAQAADCAK